MLLDTKGPKPCNQACHEIATCRAPPNSKRYAITRVLNVIVFREWFVQIELPGGRNDRIGMLLRRSLRIAPHFPGMKLLVHAILQKSDGVRVRSNEVVHGHPIDRRFSLYPLLLAIDENELVFASSSLLFCPLGRSQFAFLLLWFLWLRHTYTKSGVFGARWHEEQFEVEGVEAIDLPRHANMNKVIQDIAASTTAKSGTPQPQQPASTVNTATTFEAKISIATGLSFTAGQERKFDGRVRLPKNVQPTYEGKYVKHFYRFRARLDVFGTDPDSGWMALRVLSK